MKNNRRILLLTWTLGAVLPCVAPAQQPAAADSSFEEPPVLSAKTILKPEFAAGPGFTVQDRVPTFGGRNRYTIDSDYGSFDADGNTMLLRRIQEIGAIRALKDVSRTDTYKKALGTAITSPLVVAKSAVQDPVGTVTGVPKGIWKFMNRTGQKAKEKTQGRERSQYEDSSAAELVGFAKTKRAVALQLGVDPYSSNKALQKELNGVSWASFAGKTTFTIGTLPISGAAGLALSGAGLTGTLNKALVENGPSDLRLRNLKSLLAMGCTRGDANKFLNNPAFDPAVQTATVMHLETMNNVANRASFIDLAGAEADDEGDALFFLETSRILSELHNGKKPLARIESLGQLPIALDAKGGLVVALQWDYAAWTQRASDFVGWMKSTTVGKKKPSKFLIALSGDASPVVQQKLKDAGIDLVTRTDPGSLR